MMPAMLDLANIAWIEATGRAGGSAGCLRLLDQTLLPTQVVYLDCTSVEQVWQAIKRLSVRGAPAIGIAAAYGCVLAAQAAEGQAANPARGPDAQARVQAAVAEAAEYLATSRPTAVNLFWAVKRMAAVRPATAARLLAEARTIHADEAACCRQIGAHAYPLLERLLAPGPGPNPREPAVLTHCNAGALAAAGPGTATAPLYLAQERGLRFGVYADETRPLLQGARLTAFELHAAGIPVTVICDNMAAQVLREGRVRLVVVGADRIAANGDTANKIGTYGLAILARYHGVPFYVAAPSSTFDLTLPDGAHIPIEERAAEEITEGFGRRTAPPGVGAYSPAFDVTPHELINGIMTERGVVAPVTAATIARALHAPGASASGLLDAVKTAP
jgi:methylthioribose-1-phosphate isomerase